MESEQTMKAGRFYLLIATLVFMHYTDSFSILNRGMGGAGYFCTCWDVYCCAGH